MKIFGKILAIFRAIVFTLSMALHVFPFIFLGIFIPWKDKHRYALRRSWVKNFFIPFGNIKVTVSGEQNFPQPALYISNHRSLADLFLYKYINAKIVAKAEIADYPIVSKGGEATGIIWVKRESRKSRSGTLETMKEYVTNGTNIHIFPEGTTTDQQHTKQFKTGVFRVSIDTEVPIIPIVIEFRDMKDAWVVDSIFKHFTDIFSSWKTEVKIHFGEPMYGTDAKELTQRAEDYVNEKLHEMQVGWSKTFPQGRDTK